MTCDYTLNRVGNKRAHCSDMNDERNYRVFLQDNMLNMTTLIKFPTM